MKLGEYQTYKEQQLAGFSPMKISVHEEQLLQNYMFLLLKNTLHKHIESKEESIKIFATASFIMKKYFYLHGFLDTRNPNQLMMISLYLAMKLEENSEQAIKSVVQILKSKPKNAALIHFGDPHYGDLELNLIKSLKYDLHIPAFLTTVNSIIYFCPIFESTIHSLFLANVELFIYKGFMNAYFNTLSLQVIAIAVVECGLIKTMEQQVQGKHDLQYFVHQNLQQTDKPDAKTFLIKLSNCIREHFDKIKELEHDLIKMNETNLMQYNDVQKKYYEELQKVNQEQHADFTKPMSRQNLKRPFN